MLPSRADRRDLLQDFSVHGEYIGGDGGGVLPKWCTTGLVKTELPLREWTSDCLPGFPKTPKQKNGSVEILSQRCRLDFYSNYWPFANSVPRSANVARRYLCGFTGVFLMRTS